MLQASTLRYPHRPGPRAGMPRQRAVRRSAAVIEHVLLVTVAVLLALGLTCALKDDVASRLASNPLKQVVSRL